MEAVGTVIASGVVCSNSKCRARLNIKITNSNSSQQDLAYTFSQEESPPKTRK